MRKSFHALFTFLVLAIVLAGCSSKEEKTNTDNKEQSEELQTVEELKIGLPTDVGPLNIYTGNLDYLTELVYDKLFAPSPYVDKPQPWLAESAEQLDDTTWIVKIRSGIKWHDGEDFTAEDVKFTYEYYRDGPANRHTHHVSEVPQIDVIELEDENTIRFECGYACPSLDTITFADLPILPKHIWENVKNPRKYTDLAVGTGPYKLVAYTADQSYKFEANTDYFMGAPLVQKLNMPIIKDPTAMFNALRSGEIDISARTVPAELQDTFVKSNNMKVAETSALSIVELKLNYDNAPFNIEKFRKAMSLSVDRQSIVDTVLLGQGTAGLKGYPHPDSPWTNPNLSTPFNAKQAQSIFDELKYVDINGDGMRETSEGKELKLSLKVSSSEPVYVRVAEMLKAQFADVGINVEVVTLDAGTMATLFQSRDFELSLGLIGPHGVADPDQFIMSHRATYLWTKGLEYPQMDTLIEKWMAANTIEDRKQISFDMQTLFNNQPTSIALYYPEEKFAYNKDVYDQWVESLGYGIINKYSFLPQEVRDAVAAKPATIVE
ncbi:ABC transporter substrate-binding protein [Peribacillus asahii]|uniref:ABC transporter substrate-binding protein n=1 Tax=Peribacillus asahii TaxID=228899 RepID=UPI0020797FAC|nr:ABC transporter substrate-binding protein [Peribacillus asahii]USK70264.1 ABC transporter substrate-binding protein [Peribacillus asahii]